MSSRQAGTANSHEEYLTPATTTRANRHRSKLAKKANVVAAHGLLVVI